MKLVFDQNKQTYLEYVNEIKSEQEYSAEESHQ